MPKRSAEDKIAYYSKKLEMLQNKENKRRRRVIVYSDSSDNENMSDNEYSKTNNEPDASDQAQTLEDVITQSNAQSLPSLDPDILLALGDPAQEEVVYGEDIHPDLAQRWTPLLRKGLTEKELKEKLLKEYPIPNNCKLFRAPLLNPEISAAVSEFARARDKKIENGQQQLGIGLTAINRAMTLLLTSDNKVQAVKCLSDACRILSDLHAADSLTRKKSLTQGLEKSFLNLIQDTDRDETLFGADLSEKIKASKAIEKQGSQIKKPDNIKPVPGPSSSRPTKFQGNSKGPSRTVSNRGGRGTSRKTPYTNQRATSSTQSNFNPSRIWNKASRAGPRT